MSIVSDNLTEGLGGGGGAAGAGVIASKIPHAYLYHNTTNAPITTLVQNIPQELVVDAVFAGNLFTNSGDGVIVSASARSFKASVSYFFTLRSASSSASYKVSVRKDGATPPAGQAQLGYIISNNHRPNGINKIIDFSLGTASSLWIENVSNNVDSETWSLSCVVQFIGWL